VGRGGKHSYSLLMLVLLVGLVSILAPRRRLAATVFVLFFETLGLFLVVVTVRSFPLSFAFAVLLL